MKRLSLAIALGLLGMGLLAGRSLADNEGPNTTKQAPSPSDKPSSVQTTELAGQLADWARAKHDAVGLATAARVLASDAPSPMDKSKLDKKPSAEAPADAPKSPTLDPDALIAEAKTMAAGDADVLAAIDQIAKTIPQSRGHTGGAYIDSDTLAPSGTMTYTMQFNGGETMEVAVVTTVSGGITYHVFDENGNEITSLSTDHFINTPKWTGKFRVLLVNNTGLALPYTMATN